jgi:hypothetical protein
MMQMPHINGFLGCVVLAALAVQAGGVVNFPSPQFSNLEPLQKVSPSKPCPQQSGTTFYVDKRTEAVNYNVPRWSMLREFWYEVKRDGSVAFHVRLCEPLPDSSDNLMALRINFADSQIVAPLHGYSYACAGGKVSPGQAAIVGYEAPGKEPILSWLSVVVRKDVVTIAVPASEVPLLGKELLEVYSFYGPREHGCLNLVDVICIDKELLGSSRPLVMPPCAQ